MVPHACARRAVGQFRELVLWAEEDRARCEAVKKVPWLANIDPPLLPNIL
jgi:hypothetical protein